MDNTVPPEVAELAKRTVGVRPRRRDARRVRGARASSTTQPAELRQQLQSQAREAGLLAPHVPKEWGGCGLDVRGQAVVFEEAGYSLLGPLALNCAAPDEGNMHLLERVAKREQKEQYLRPLAAGEIRSCFAMTEPAPGAGSDPAMLSTTATKVDGGWRIDGRKWFISGARGAGFAICMARTSGAAGERGGATMFLVDADNPGMQVVRDIDTLDEGLFGGHSEVVFDNCLVGPDVGARRGRQGLRVRAGAAGAGPAHPLHALARPRPACARHRRRLGRHPQVVRRHPRRPRHGAAADRRLRDRHGGQPGADPRTPPRCSTAARAAAPSRPSPRRSSPRRCNRVVDRAVQICGALGISGDVLLSRYLREVRPFRIYDGPSEVHRWAIGRRVVSQRRRAIEAGEQPRFSAARGPS